MPYYWTKGEISILEQLVGNASYSTLQKRLQGRSLESIKKKARQLGFTLSRGTWTLNRVMQETGYNWKQIYRARDVLNQYWRRATETKAKHGKFLITDEQALEIMDYLKREHYPFTSRYGQPTLRWSRYHTICSSCKSTKRPHYGRGMCESCWKRDRRLYGVAPR